MDDIRKQIIYKPLGELKPYKRNPRKNDGAVDAVAASIKEFGFKVPIVIDTNGEIVAGHTRLKAAKKLGLAEVPCIIADDLSPDQIKAFRLADNKTAELAEWDFELLQLELEDIKLDMSEWKLLDWSTGGITEEEQTYEQQKAEFERRMAEGELSEDSEEYQEFLQKFEPKKTTDDCYTPPNIYETVADFVAEEFGVEKKNFVRPFYPGGDYQNEKYKTGDIVVDNPPFSIISEICRWYKQKGIKFFLFAPSLTLFGIREAQKICVGVAITYENGANVSTSFVTNMGDFEAKSCPKLYKILQEANDTNLRAMRKEFPKYDYPVEVVTSSKLAYLAKYGQEFEIKSGECKRISELESQKQAGKAIFGSGYLISTRKAAEKAAAEKAAAEKAAAEKAAAEKAAAEKAAAERWTLSQNELNIINSLK